MSVPPGGLLGGALALLALFLPGFLLMVGAFPFWAALRASAAMQSALAGVNAAVIGLLLAALYRPVFVSAVFGVRDFAFALAALALLGLRVPPWAVVLAGAGAAEALAWLGFLDAAELGGCLALDMGLGKTPTMLAHLGRTAGSGAALVVAPPAVVGNWAAEAKKFTPDLRVVVHHGASRATARQLEREVAGADVVITTYGTAVRDVEALAQHSWSRVVLDGLVADSSQVGGDPKQGAILAAITALKQICNHPAAYQHGDDRPLAGRSGKLTRLEEIVESVFAAGERILVFTHFAEWGKRLADHLTDTTGVPISCYHGGLARGARDRLVEEFQQGEGPGALVLSLKAGGTGLNLTAASHVVLYDRWWNPAVEDQARDRAWRIGQTRTVVSHRLVCPGTVDERVEEVVAGKRHFADLVLPKSSSLSDLSADQLRVALGLRPDTLLTEEDM